MCDTRFEKEKIYTGIGILNYSYNLEYGYRLVANTDQEIFKYYRYLIPKSKKPNYQRYQAHISLVRYETPINLNYWGLYEGQEIEYSYSNIIKFSSTYCWLDIYCSRFEQIRRELGLAVDSPYTRPPESYEKIFHMTIGNYKF